MLYAAKASRPDGRRFRAEESPGSTEKRCRITSGGGDPRESATENKPPPGLAPAARVKRCGKSAPRAWRHERHGKPHREQDRIGAMRGSRTLDPSLDHRPGWLLEAAGDGRPRGMAITRRGSRGAVQNPAYRPAGGRSPPRKMRRGHGFVHALFFVRPAWAHSCGWKSRRKLVTASEVKRNCGRATDRGEAAWIETAG